MLGRMARAREESLPEERESDAARIRALEAENARLRDENAALKAQEPSLFELLVRTIVDYAIFLLDPEGRILSWNAGARQLKGYAEAEILGAPLGVFYPPDTPPEHSAEHLMAEARRKGHVVDEGWRVRKDGSRFWAAVVLTALRGESGELIGYAKVTRDLTDKKRAEEELRRLNAELMEANAHKDQFLSIISHELRTPLNAILGFGSLLADGAMGELSPAQAHGVERMLEGADDLLALIDDLLDMSRIQAGRLRLVPEPMSLTAVGQGVLARLAPLAAAKGLSLAARLPEDLPPLEADPQRVGQMLTNLISNAIKFTPPGGRIEVRASMGPEDVRCEVSDTGIGIAEANLPRLFQRFGQLDSSNTRAAGGTGLGLSIVKALATAHGGAVGVRSAPGQGSTFWFTLPLSLPPAAP